MCVLCGEMISSFHWSDLSFDEQGANLSALQDQRDRMRARLKRVKILNEILSFYRLNIKEWQGSKFILSDLVGKSVIVNDLGDLWLKVQELSKKEIDLLDDNFIKFMQNKNG